MPTSFAHRDFEGTTLSPAAQALYVALASGHPCPEGQDELAQELHDYGLILPHPQPPSPGRHYITRNPIEVASEKRDLILRQVGRAMAAANALPEFLRPLATAYQRAAPQLQYGAVEYVEGMEAVNARISEIVATCTEELLTAQPKGPRRQESLDLSLPRDIAALERGVSMRTLYRAECRTHEPTATRVRQVTAAGGHVRTLAEDFARTLVFDRRVAVVADYTPTIPGRDQPRALILHDPGVVALAASVFDGNWDRASVWKGEISTAASAEVTERQKAIMRHLIAGAAQSAIAASLEISERTVNTEIAELRRLSDCTTLTQLGYWWAMQEIGRG